MEKMILPVTDEEFGARQHILDIEKWLASEAAGRDLCGTMSYCAVCDKTQTHPCARAEARFRLAEEAAAAQAAREQEVLEEIAAAQPEEALPEGYEWVTRYRRTFQARLIQNEKAQDGYTEIKNALSELAGVKVRTCQTCENYRFEGRKIAKVNIGGKTLTLYLALDPADYEESKYRFADVSDKKTYAETPMKVRVTGSRSIKHAKELIADLAARFSIPVTGHIFMDYHAAYQPDEALIKKGLIKPYRARIKRKKK